MNKLLWALALAGFLTACAGAANNPTVGGADPAPSPVRVQPVQQPDPGAAGNSAPGASSLAGKPQPSNSSAPNAIVPPGLPVPAGSSASPPPEANTSQGGQGCSQFDPGKPPLLKPCPGN